MLARGVLKVNYSVQAAGETPPVIVVPGTRPLPLPPSSWYRSSSGLGLGKSL